MGNLSRDGQGLSTGSSCCRAEVASSLSGWGCKKSWTVHFTVVLLPPPPTPISGRCSSSTQIVPESRPLLPLSNSSTSLGTVLHSFCGLLGLSTQFSSLTSADALSHHHLLPRSSSTASSNVDNRRRWVCKRLWKCLNWKISRGNCDKFPNLIFN